MNEVVWDCLGIVGVGCIMGGLACWSWPLAFVFLGSSLIAAGLIGGKVSARRKLRGNS